MGAEFLAHSADGGGNGILGLAQCGGHFGIGGRSLVGAEEDFQFAPRLQLAARAEFFAQGTERPPQNGARPQPVKLVLRGDLVTQDLLELALAGFEVLEPSRQC